MSRNIITIGIDPGKTGALAVVLNGRTLVQLHRTTTMGVGRAASYDHCTMNSAVAPFAPIPPHQWEEDIDAQLVRLEQGNAMKDEALFYEAVAQLKVLYNRRQSTIKDACALAILETQMARHGEGPSHILTNGKGWGIWIGLLAANGVPFESVKPRAWQTAMGVFATNAKGTSPEKAARDKKARHCSAALKLFPGAMIGTHHGSADAVLMAVYGYRRYVGEV